MLKYIHGYISCSTRQINVVRQCTKRSQMYYSRESLIPSNPTWKSIEESDLPKKTEITEDMIDHLEHLALVDFGNQEAIDRLSAAVRFADHLSLVDTNKVEPLDMVLEDRSLYLRNDEVTEGNCQKEILLNASKTEEEYFVVPTGNIPLKPKTEDFSSGAKIS